MEVKKQELEPLFATSTVRMKTILSNQTVDIPENGTRLGVCVFLTSLLHALYLVPRPHEYVLS